MNKLYGRLARTNLKNNKPLYIPYILAGVMTVALFYLMVFLNNNPGLDQMRGGYYIKTIMGMGVYIIAFFSLIFLFSAEGRIFDDLSQSGKCVQVFFCAFSFCNLVQ